MGQKIASKKIRFGVVGIGHIAQVAVLPAFQHAENCELKALFSGDEVKLRELGERHGVPLGFRYEDFDRVLERGELDAVYIALPNHLHCDYSVRAARAGVHVLCEKPMAPSEAECERMIEAADKAKVKLMVAYRLHFDSANLDAIRAVGEGRLGVPRLFESTFSQDVKAGDVRLLPIEQGGGSVFDMGVYCINAARYLFRAEPESVSAVSARGNDPRFEHSDEMTTAILSFPGDCLAEFTSSFGAVRHASYRMVGTQGKLELTNAYEYAKPIHSKLETLGGDVEEHSYPKRDQFAPELVYFAECVRSGTEPEPNGYEGLADVKIVRAIYESARQGKRLGLTPVERSRRPDKSQEIRRPGISPPTEVHASGPSH